MFATAKSAAAAGVGIGIGTLSLWTCEHCMKINRDKIDPCIFCGMPKPKAK